MKHPDFLNATNIAIGQGLLTNCQDYHVIDDNYLIVVAPDSTVWACYDQEKSVHLDSLKLVQRLV